MKEFKTIIGLSIVALIGLVPLLFTSDSMNENKVDVYLFFDKLRYPENIAYDISEILTVSIFIYLIWKLVPTKKYKRYVFAFFISSIISIFGYFLFYSKFVSLFQIPILITMIAIIYRKYDYEKGNNIR